MIKVSWLTNPAWCSFRVVYFENIGGMAWIILFRRLQIRIKTPRRAIIRFMVSEPFYWLLSKLPRESIAARMVAWIAYHIFPPF